MVPPGFFNVSEHTNCAQYNFGRKSPLLSTASHFFSPLLPLAPGAAVRPRKALEPFVLLLSPYAPHLAEELWSRLGHSSSLAYEPWPQADEALLVVDAIKLPVQVRPLSLTSCSCVSFRGEGVTGCCATAHQGPRVCSCCVLRGGFRAVWHLQGTRQSVEVRLRTGRHEVTNIFRSSNASVVFHWYVPVSVLRPLRLVPCCAMMASAVPCCAMLC